MTKAITKQQQEALERIGHIFAVLVPLVEQERRRQSQMGKDQLESLYTSLRVHAARLGLEVPEVGAFSSTDKYLDAARSMFDQAAKWSASRHGGWCISGSQRVQLPMPGKERLDVLRKAVEENARLVVSAQQARDEVLARDLSDMLAKVQQHLASAEDGFRQALIPYVNELASASGAMGMIATAHHFVKPVE